MANYSFNSDFNNMNSYIHIIHGGEFSESLIEKYFKFMKVITKKKWEIANNNNIIIKL